MRSADLRQAAAFDGMAGFLLLGLQTKPSKAQRPAKEHIIQQGTGVDPSRRGGAAVHSGEDPTWRHTRPSDWRDD